MTIAQAIETKETPMPDTDKVLVMKRVLPATPDRVFDAWTRPEMMRRWLSPAPMTTPEAESDLRVGGGYRIVMLSPEGESFIPSGVYEEIVPNEKLVFTWKWAHLDDVSRVTIELTPVGGSSTEMTLTHEGLVTQELCDKHEEGWDGCFDKLAVAVCV